MPKRPRGEKRPAGVTGTAVKVMRIATGDDYPPGIAGELAVCYFRRSGSDWIFEGAKDRDEANLKFESALDSDEVLILPIDRGPQTGLPSRVVWLAECSGGTEWRRIKETEGAKQHMRRGE